MAIRAALRYSFLLVGDGTSSSATVEFSIAAVNPVPIADLRQINPTTVVPYQLDESTSDLPTAVAAGNIVTFLFPSPLATGTHELDCLCTF
jgi:hypothetical protein